MNDNTHSIVIERCVPADDGRVRDGGGEDKPHEVVEQLGKDRNLPGMKRAATPVQRVHLAHDPRCLQGVCQARQSRLSGCSLTESVQSVVRKSTQVEPVFLLPGHGDGSAILVMYRQIAVHAVHNKLG